MFSDNTSFSGRYNTIYQFVSGGEQVLLQPMSQNLPPMQPPPEVPKEDEDIEMAEGKADTPGPMEEMGEKARRNWMKNNLSGVKKMPNLERRRRQNENLRRLLMPRNALMILNEMIPDEHVISQFIGKPETTSQSNAPNPDSFSTDLAVEGNVYKGYGDNKLMARNCAAEQAIRDLMIKKINKANNRYSGAISGSEAVEEEVLPIMQLASFALYKLFKQWEFDGHKMPQLKPNFIIKRAVRTVYQLGARVSHRGLFKALPLPPAEERKVPELPHNASAMHPAVLLTYMRPNLVYRELVAEGDRPQDMLFTMSVEVDGKTYIGRAPNKKEARKVAAKAACGALFHVVFDKNICAYAPVYN